MRALNILISQFVSVLLLGSFSLAAIENGGNGPRSFVIAGDGATPSIGDILEPHYASPAALRHLAGAGPRGEASYSKQIALPPSLHSPEIFMTYSSSAASGFEPGQYGWSLDGILEIRKAKGPRYQDKDIYTLSGGRLTGNLVPGTTSGSIKFYKLQATSAGSYAKVWLESDVWTIEAKGITYMLHKADPLPYWRIRESLDRFNNKISYTYDAKGRISRIEYGGTGGPSPHPANIKIIFSFVNTLGGNGNAFKERAYSEGGYIVLDKVLEKIEIHAEDPIGSGNFSRVNAYTISSVLQEGMDMIAAIRYEGATSAEFEDSARFTYQNINTGKRDTSGVAPSYPTDADPTVVINTQFRSSTFDPFPKSRIRTPSALVDINGDGLLDRVLDSGSTGYSSFSKLASEVQPSSNWSIESLVKVGDVADEDGEPDDPYAVSFEGVYEWKPFVTNATGPQAGISESENNLFLGNPHNMTLSQLVDLDGDGIRDLIVSKNATTWQVYYGTGGTSLFTSAYTIACPPGNTLLYSSATRTYQASSFPAGTLTSTISSKIWEIRDVDGDGWGDIFSGGGYFRKIPSRSEGWAEWISLENSPFNYVSAVKLSIAADPVYPLAFPMAPQPPPQGYNHTALTFTVHSFMDINGDGLLDAVDAAGASVWKVKFGKGIVDNGIYEDGKVTFMGFDAEWTDWSAPFSYSAVFDEGFPATSYRVENENPPLLHSFKGHSAKQIKGILDIDGDGKPDAVNVSSGLYFRNIGNGFETTGRALPDWFPGAGISKTPLAPAQASYQGGASPQDYFTGSASYPCGGIVDLDGDRRLDVAIGTGANCTEKIEFGKSTWPFLLIRVDNTKGGITSIGYKSTATGNHKDAEGEGYTLSIHQPEAYRLYTEDTVTGQTAETQYVNSNGVRKNGVFQGFGHRTQHEFLNGVLQSTTEAAYELSDDFAPLLLTYSVFTDRNLCNASSEVNCTSDFTERFRMTNHYQTYGTSAQYRLPQSSTVTEFGEGAVTTQTSRTRTFTYDQDSNPLTIAFDGGGDSTISSTTTLTWARDVSTTLYKLGSLKVTNGTNWLAYSRFFYDGGPLDSIALKGFLTKSETCLSRQGSSCSAYATWQFTDAGRGQIRKTIYPSNPNNWIERTYGYNGAIVSSTINSLGHTTASAIDARGRVTAMTGIDGVTNISVYDGLNRLLEKQTQSRTVGAAAKKKVSYAYQTALIPNYTSTKVFMADGSIESESWVDLDGFGNEMRTWSPHPDGQYIKKEFLYSLNGTLLQTSYPTGAANHTPFTPLGFQQILYKCHPDAYGTCRESWEDYSAGLGEITPPQADAGERITVDALGYFKRVVLNAIDKPIAVYAGQLGIGPKVQTGSNTWAAVGNLKKMVLGSAGSGDTFAYIYDQAKRIRKVKFGANGTANRIYQTYTYDGSRYKKRVDAEGLYHEVTDYDDLDRVVGFKISDQNSTDELHYRGIYDTLIPGKLTKTVDPVGSTNYYYDEYARPQTVTRHWKNGGTAPKKFSYTYDLQGKTLTETYPSKMTLTRIYSRGIETKYEFNGGGISNTVVEKSYHPDTGGLMTLKAPSTDLTMEFIRNPSGLRINTHRMTINTNSSQRDYSYASSGRIQSVNYTYNSMNGATGGGKGLHVFEYDHLNRLLSHHVDATTVANWRYQQGYPGMSTLATSSSQGPSSGTYAYTYGPYNGLRRPTRRVSGMNWDNYAYDSAGRVSRWDSGTSSRLIRRTIAYDGAGRVRVIDLGQTPAKDQRLSYDYHGNLVEIKVGGSPAEFIQTFLNWHHDPTRNRLTEHISRLVDIENGHIQWKLSELSGHTSRQYPDLPPQNSAPAWSVAITAVGEDFSGSTTDRREGFHGGQSYGTASGFDITHMEARSMMQREGNWMQPEPLLSFGVPEADLWDPRSLSPYAYARRNPVNFSDPSGFATGPSTPGDPGTEGFLVEGGVWSSGEVAASGESTGEDLVEFLDSLGPNPEVIEYDLDKVPLSPEFHGPRTPEAEAAYDTAMKNAIIKVEGGIKNAGRSRLARLGSLARGIGGSLLRNLPKFGVAMVIGMSSDAAIAAGGEAAGIDPGAMTAGGMVATLGGLVSSPLGLVGGGATTIEVQARQTWTPEYTQAVDRARSSPLTYIGF